MDSFITFLVAITIAAVASWLKRRAAAGQQDDQPQNQAGPPRPPAQPRPPARPSSWEEELRRLLEGENAPPVAPPPVFRPPPVVVAQPAPKPVLRPSAPAPAPTPIPRAVLVSPPRGVTSAPPLPASVQIPVEQMAPLIQSKQAYERASQIDRKMAEHIQMVSGQRVQSTVVTRRAIAPEMLQAVSLLKSPRTARAAIVASFIFGPPRSLEDRFLEDTPGGF